MKTAAIRIAAVLAVPATSRLIAAEVAVAKAAATMPSGFPGKKTSWNGYGRNEFSFGQRHCTVFVPKSIAAGGPWIWRARLFGHVIRNNDGIDIDGCQNVQTPRPRSHAAAPRGIRSPYQ